jgi:hypothetical protein
MLSRLPGQPDELVLHDNRTDRYQLANLAEREPETVSRLTNEELIPWLRKTGDPWLRNLQPGRV